jgi:glyoxylase-like metal-dependent hydrolase (beta-lactamase superfamily II)
MEILTLDLDFQGMNQAIAAYLVVGPQGPVLVETGPGSTLDVLQQRLKAHGYAPTDVRHILVTHIHLDHAGAAGWWAQQGAQVYVHHVGAPHLVDPSRLLSSARRIYGASMDNLWGDMLPAPASHVHPVRDGETIEAGGLQFVALDTPGHAHHHHVYRLGDITFTGDAAAVRLPGSDFISLPAPPPEFNLPVWQATLQRLADQNLATIYPTHFGPVHDVRKHLDRLAGLLQASAEFVRAHMEQGTDRELLVEAYQDWVWERARAQGVTEEALQIYETVNPTFMSVDGMIRYWRKQTEQ